MSVALDHAFYRYREARRQTIGHVAIPKMRLRLRTAIRRVPRRRGQPPLAVGGPPVAVRGRELVPELAGDRLVLLVEPLAVIGVFAQANLTAEAEESFSEPIRIGQRLPRSADNVAYAAREIVLGHFEIVDAAGQDHRHVAAGIADRVADRRGRRRVAAERPALVGNELRHALVPAAPGIGIGGGPHGGLLGVIELAA